MVCFTATLVLAHTGKMSSKTRRESLPVCEKKKKKNQKQQEPHNWPAYSFPASARFATATASGTWGAQTTLTAAPDPCKGRAFRIQALFPSHHVPAVPHLFASLNRSGNWPVLTLPQLQTNSSSGKWTHLSYARDGVIKIPECTASACQATPGLEDSAHHHKILQRYTELNISVGRDQSTGEHSNICSLPFTLLDALERLNSKLFSNWPRPLFLRILYS